MNTILLETNVENFNFKVSIIDSYIFTVRVYTAYTGIERAESVRFVWTVRDGERTGRDVENVCIGEVQLRGSRRRWALLSGPSTGSVTGIGRGEAVPQGVQLLTDHSTVNSVPNEIASEQAAYIT